MNIYDKIKKGQEEQAEIIKSVLGGGEFNDLIQKGKAAVAGEIRTWGGKKYKKQVNGKWLEVSEHGMTSNEHSHKATRLKETADKSANKGLSTKESMKLDEESNVHAKIAGKLSDKEFSDEEVGLDGKKKEWDREYRNTAVADHMMSFKEKVQNSTTEQLKEMLKKDNLALENGMIEFELEQRLNGGKSGDIKKSISAIEIINQNDIIEKSHIIHDFSYSDQFSVSKKGKELKQKFAEAILDEVKKIKQYMTELQVLMVEIGELPIVPAGERQYYKVDGYEGKLAEMPNFYDVDEWLPKGSENELLQKKIKYNNVVNKVIDCSIEMVLLNTFIRNLDDNKEYKLSVTQASKLGF